MRIRIVIGIGIVVLLIGTFTVPEATAGTLAVLAVPVFLWAVLGLLSPSLARLKDRRASVKIWAASAGLLIVSFLVTLTQSEFRQELTEQQASRTVSAAEFRQIQTGMTYQQVVQIVGFRGEETVRNEFAGTTTVMYQWVNAGGSNMNAMFQDGRLTQKAQAGLR